MTDKPQIKVAIIDNSIDPSVYKPVRHWSSFLSVEWKAFKATAREFPDFNEGFTHMILTGSEASILDRRVWVDDEIEVVQKAVQRGLSILGSCYGHQVLAIALAGPNFVGRCVRPEVGWIPFRITKDNSLLGQRRTVFAFSSHFDEVKDLGSDFSVLCSTKNCVIQAFQWRNKPVWGVQFHPEIDIPEATFFIKKCVDKKDDRSGHYEAAWETTPRDSGIIRNLCSNFLTLSQK